MNSTNNKNNMSQKLNFRQIFFRLKQGLLALKNDKKKKLVFLLSVCALIATGMLLRTFALNHAPYYLSIMIKNLYAYALIVVLIVGVVAFLIHTGAPIDAEQITEALLRVGLVNKAGETPFLISANIDPSKENIRVLEFESLGVPVCTWTDKKEALEAALNLIIVKIREGEAKNRVLIFTVQGKNLFSAKIDWDDSFLSKNDFELVMGENAAEQVSVDLARIPHVLLGGSTGSGKTELLKLMLYQGLKKGAKVIIADFKGGVDFHDPWCSMCEIITDEKALLEKLKKLEEELQKRKEILRTAQASNISEYRKLTGNRLNRIIFACDEVAELLDKTGLSKEKKELVNQIESLLSILARQGRAFGFNLILATQRPDANILSGQIRNNIDFRVCGRADKVLSMIILDGTVAADVIPKDTAGRFVTNDDRVFQAYWLGENGGGW